MIKIHNVILKALCDACGAKLSHEGQTNADGTPHGTHFGELRNEFGFGSPLDGLDDPTAKLVLCEACYTKVFKALNIPISYYDTPWHLRVGLGAFEVSDDKPFDNEKDDRRGAYHAPYWVCKFCDWLSTGHGYSIPTHRCESITKIMGVRQDSCGVCTKPASEVSYSDPLYSEREDAWVHHKKNSSDSEHCKASPLMLELMRKGERIDPEWKARLDAARKGP
jgi:hypothetical protein